MDLDSIKAYKQLDKQQFNQTKNEVVLADNSTVTYEEFSNTYWLTIDVEGGGSYILRYLYHKPSGNMMVIRPTLNGKKSISSIQLKLSRNEGNLYLMNSENGN